MSGSGSRRTPEFPCTRREAIRRLTAGAGSVAAGSLVPGYLSAGTPGTPGPDSCAELAGARVRWLIGWSAGGGYDAYSRLLEPTLERRLGAQLILENLPGAGGVLATRRLMSSRADGRTLAILNGTGLSLAPALRLQVTPDFETDLTVIARIVGHQQALIVAADSAFTSMESVVETGRRRPLVMGVTGLATVNTLLTALLRPLFGVEVEVVAGYPGSREIMAAVARGELDGAIAGIETPLPLDTVRILLRFERDEGLANADPTYASIPTLTGPSGVLTRGPGLFALPSDQVEATAADLSSLMEVGRIVAGPPGLPQPVRDCLRDTLLAALGDQDFRRAATRARRSVGPADHAEVLRHFRAARRAGARWQGVLDEFIRRSNLSR